MYKFIKLSSILFFCIIPKITAQEIRVIDNKGTIEKVRNNNVYTSNTDPNIAPNEVVENDIWLDTSTTPSATKVFDNNSQWVVLETGVNTFTGFFIISGPGGTVTSSQSITVSGIPFKPSQITFTANPNIESLNIDSDNGIANNINTLNNSFGTMNGFARIVGATKTQQVIYLGANGNSINDISRYASSSNCIGIRYGNQNGDHLGKITASLTTFNTNGFTINATHTLGSVGNNTQKREILNEGLVILYTAYK